MMETDDDTWWSASHRETNLEMDARARVFLHRLFQRDYAASTKAGSSGQFIAVVTHSGFIQACVRALGGGDYKPANAEVIPLAVVRKTNDVVSSLGIYGRSGGGEEDDSFSLVSYMIMVCLLCTLTSVVMKYGSYVSSVWKKESGNRRRQRQRGYEAVLGFSDDDERVDEMGSVSLSI
eukprot:14767646-Ditylum_brightwellii.AAC.1